MKKFITLLIVLLLVIGVGVLFITFKYNQPNVLNEPVKETSIFDHYQLSQKEKQQLLAHSKSQIKQDIFVYLELGKKKNGFFIEFGATNGVDLSNSYMLEQQFGWKGILAEPAMIWHEQLKKNRSDTIIETLCVWSKTGDVLKFNETSSAPGLSTINKFSNSDGHADSRSKGKIYEVKTISLLDLLRKHHAPQNIDYLSIDTEGSEFDILAAFFKNNDYFKIKIITCEHNYTENREKIYELLTKNGYVRKHTSVSKWDDFYVFMEEDNK